MVTSEKKALSDYITARLELDADAEGYGIRTAGVEEETARTWDWVRTGRAQREALKQVARVLTEDDSETADLALTWLAAAWAANAPLIDDRSRPYTANGAGLTYVTECCLVIPTPSRDDLVCWSCQEPVDDVLALTPRPSGCDTPWRGPATDLERAEAAGRRAYVQDRPAAPAADATVMRLVKKMPVGGGAIAIFKAFQRGFTAEADAAAAAVLADPTTQDR